MWAQAIDQWIVVLIRIGAVVLTLGLVWSALQYVQAAIAGSGFVASQLIFRAMGMVFAFALLAAAPAIVTGIRAQLVEAMVHP